MPNRFVEVLTHKVAGVPVYIPGVILVLGVAWWIRRKQSATPNPNASLGGPTSTFPYANPMNYSSDVFVNVTNPPGVININNPPENEPPRNTPGPIHIQPFPNPGGGSPGYGHPIPQPPPSPRRTSATYVVRSGDTLWAIAGRLMGANNKYPALYNANKGLIEATARQHGYSSSGGGHWIFPGEKLVIPG